MLALALLAASTNPADARNNEAGVAVPCDAKSTQVPPYWTLVKANIRETAARCSKTKGQTIIVVDPSVPVEYCFETPRRSGLGACAFLTNKLLAGNGLARIRQGNVIKIVPLAAVPPGTPPDDDSW